MEDTYSCGWCDRLNVSVTISIHIFALMIQNPRIIDTKLNRQSH